MIGMVRAALPGLLPRLMPWVYAGIVAFWVGSIAYAFDKGKDACAAAFEKAQQELLLKEIEAQQEQAVVDKENAVRAIERLNALKREMEDARRDWYDLSSFDCSVPDDWADWMRGN